jgi:hypothetical protein
VLIENPLLPLAGRLLKMSKYWRELPFLSCRDAKPFTGIAEAHELVSAPAIPVGGVAQLKSPLRFMTA